MRQLDIFKGKRQRGTKAPSALEFPVHVQIARDLDRWLNPKWVWLHPANGEHRDPRTGARLKALGVKPGASDFIFSAPPNGRFHALELKREGVTPRPNQIAFLDAIRASGGVADWVDSYKQAIEVLCEWGALPDGKIKVQ